MDEADKMMEQGNEVQMTNILSMLPKQRRTGLFSATMPSQLKNFVKIGMRNPYFVDVKMEGNQEIFATNSNLLSSSKVKSLLHSTGDNYNGQTSGNT